MDEKIIKEIRKDIENLTKEIKKLKTDMEVAKNFGKDLELRYEEMLKKEEAFLGQINQEIEREITVMVLATIKKVINRETVALKILRRRIRNQVRHQVSKEILKETNKIIPEIKKFVKEEVKNKSVEIMNQLKRQTGKQLEKEVIEQVKETTSILREQKEESERKAIMDELTGIYNRRYFEAKLEDELTLAKRFRSNLCLIMFDIDHFKNINDTYGHQAGDSILAELALTAKSLMSSVDSLCRYGGEEFAIILPETKIEEAIDLAEKLRNEVEEHLFYIGDKVINITISAGIAEYPTHALLKQGLIEKADSALYYAKNTGRNNIKIAIK
jgi:diguanylate cyclase (GGDEF)-like protein